MHFQREAGQANPINCIVLEDLTDFRSDHDSLVKYEIINLKIKSTVVLFFCVLVRSVILKGVPLIHDMMFTGHVEVELGGSVSDAVDLQSTGRGRQVYHHGVAVVSDGGVSLGLVTSLELA